MPNIIGLTSEQAAAFRRDRPLILRSADEAMSHLNRIEKVMRPVCDNDNRTCMCEVCGFYNRVTEAMELLKDFAADYDAALQRSPATPRTP